MKLAKLTFQLQQNLTKLHQLRILSGLMHNLMEDNCLLEILVALIRQFCKGVIVYKVSPLLEEARQNLRREDWSILQTRGEGRPV